MKPDADICFRKQYSRPRWEWDVINDHVDKLLDDNRIAPSSSPYNSPVLVVPRKGPKKWRVVVDFRSLNLASQGDAYPLPNIEDILQQIGASSYFSVIDMADGFHQIPMDPDDACKTAFTTPYGHHEWRVMPFGLKGAPARFQRLMDHVLIGLQGIKCFVYLDDLVLYAQTLQEHNQKLLEIFQRFRKYNLKIQTNKCDFLKDEIVYLGHTISKDGVLPNPEKIKDVLNYPAPATTKDVKQFVALCSYYRKFVPNFSDIANPLVALLKKDTKFHWNAFHQEAFDNLKARLTSAPILIHPDYNKEFILTTDASLHAIGGVLSQGEIGSDRPIAYASRKLNSAERNYPAIDRELLAVVAMCKHFRHFLYGRRFTIFTDHRPLVWLFNVKDLNSRLTKFRLKLEEYDYEIKYKPGKQNTNADALSRIPDAEISEILEKVIPSNIDEIMRSDPQEARQKEYHELDYSDESESEDSNSEDDQEPGSVIQACRSILTMQTRSKTRAPQIAQETVDATEVKLPPEAVPLPTYRSITHDKLKKTYNQFELWSPNQHDHIQQDSRSLQALNKDDLTVMIQPYAESVPPSFISKHKIPPSFFKNFENGELRLHTPNVGILLSSLDDCEATFFHLLTVYSTFKKQKQRYHHLNLGLTDPTKRLRLNLQVILLYLFEGETDLITVFTHDLVELKNKFDIVEIIRDFHMSPLGGHQGMNRTLKRIQNYFHWPNMAQDIEQFVSSCSLCQKNKVSRLNRVPMKITTTSTKPFEKIFLDVVGPLPISISHSKYILTFQDDLTKFAGAIPMPDQEAETIGEIFVTELICRFGAPATILTDQGPNLLAQVFVHVCKLLQTHKIRTSAYHPQSNQVERTHRGLAEYLRNFVDHDKFDWCTWLPYAMFVYNTTPHSSTNFTPFELLFGHIADIPQALKQKPDPCYNYDTYSNIMKAKFQHSHKMARENILKNKNRSKAYYDVNTRPVHFQIGDQVLLRNEKRKNKLSELWTGPYEVLEIVSPENTLIKYKKVNKTVHNNRLKKFTK